MKRLLSLLLALVMVLGAIPFAAFATEPVSETEAAAGIKMVLGTELIPETAPTEETGPVEETEPVEEMEPVEETEPVGETEPVEETEPVREVEHFEIPFTVNPIYEGIYTEDDFPRSEKSDSASGQVQDHSELDFWQNQERLYAATYLSVDAATEQLKQHMINRDETFTLYFKAKTTNYNEHLAQMLLAAVAHTGKPKEGDYLQWHYAGWGGYIDYFWENGECCFVFDAQIAYSTTAAQEKELDSAVTKLLNSLNLSGKSEYQKIKAVYDYICQNITYDYANLEDETYLLKHSAYAALVNKTAVCQGYATLFYRLMLELGVDVRVIPGLDEEGYAHAWNIVKIGDVYYNLDATWDAGYDEYYYFLRNTINFLYHYRYMEYATAQFHADYPMAAEDYTEGTEGTADEYIVMGICGDEVAFTIDREKNLIIAGKGPMWDYESITSSNEVNYPPWYYWMDAFERVIVEEGVTAVGDYAFYNMSHIIDISLPETLVEIGNFTFGNLGELEAILLPTALETIGNNAFVTCKKLAEITIQDNVKVIGDKAFYLCSALRDVHFGAGVEQIGSNAFAYTELTEVILPAGVLALGDHSFFTCRQLKKVELGSSLQTIGKYAFAYSGALTGITLPETLSEIGDWAFAGSGLTEIVIPDRVTNVGVEVFLLCEQLQRAKLGESIKQIPVGLFSGCGSLAVVETSNTITSIGSFAFAGTKLESFVIPETVTFIGAAAFQETNLIEVTIPASITNLESSVFAGCVHLQRVELNNRLEKISSGVFRGCRELTSIVIPESVTSIGQAAFYGCTLLTDVNIPDGVTSFEDNLFAGCENLENITIPDGVTSIGSCTFSGCTSLAGIDIPDGVTTIGSSAFSSCENLKSITIPAAVTSIGFDAFSYCYALKEIIFLGDAPSLGAGAWGNPVFCDVTATAYYPIGNETWTEDVLKNYGGTITWVEQCVSHEFSAVEVIAPTCTDGGYTRHFCPVCKQGYTTDETEKLGHDLSDWAMDVEETCTTDGSRSRACRRDGCDYSETEVIPATGHSHVPTVTAPTCKDGGYTTHTCRCGDTYVTDEVPALGHSITYAVETAPTLETEGALVGSCSRCGEISKILLPKLNKSDYTLEVITEPTKEAEGFGRYTWKVTDYGTFAFDGNIPNVLLGDVNGDDKVSIADLMRLANYFAEDAEINEANANVNGDDKVSISDLMRLANFFAGKAELG